MVLFFMPIQREVASTCADEKFLISSPALVLHGAIEYIRLSYRRDASLNVFRLIVMEECISQ